MALVQITHEKDEQQAIASVFHKFVEGLYEPRLTGNATLGRRFIKKYRIYHDEKYDEITDDLSNCYQVCQSSVPRRFKVIYEYTLSELEDDWIYCVMKGMKLQPSSAQDVNNHIRAFPDEMRKLRKKVVDRFLFDIADGFVDSKMKVYILMNPSARMLAAGVCALTAAKKDLDLN